MPTRSPTPIHRACRTVLLFCILLLTCGTAIAQNNAPLPQSRLDIVTANGQRHSFAVEMAVTPDQQAQGLMYRQSLAVDGGMLFDFHSDRPISMWMKNTLIPLDMLFINGDGTIRTIAQRTIPQTLTAINSNGPVRAVLEVKGGTSARLGLKPGDRIDHPLFRSTP